MLLWLFFLHIQQLFFSLQMWDRRWASPRLSHFISCVVHESTEQFHRNKLDAAETKDLHSFVYFYSNFSIFFIIVMLRRHQAGWPLLLLAAFIPGKEDFWCFRVNHWTSRKKREFVSAYLLKWLKFLLASSFAACVHSFLKWTWREITQKWVNSHIFYCKLSKQSKLWCALLLGRIWFFSPPPNTAQLLSFCNYSWIYFF